MLIKFLQMEGTHDLSHQANRQSVRQICRAHEPQDRNQQKRLRPELPAPAQKQPYVPEHAPEVNKIEGNPNYTKAAATALNIYTKTDNYCFWDNTDSAVNWLGENSSTIQSYNASGGDLKLIINSNGTIAFLRL
jgi:hypothetical protein